MIEGNGPPQRCRIIAMMGSSSAQLDQAADHVARMVAPRFAGLTASTATGYWTPDGQNADGPYDIDNLMKERVLRIDLLVFPQFAAEALDLMEVACRDANRTLDLGCAHLHIECLRAEAWHRLISIPAE